MGVLVNRILRVDLNSIQNIIPHFQAADRSSQIQELKHAIYQYRNQVLSCLISTEITRQDCIHQDSTNQENPKLVITNDDMTKTEYGKPYLRDYSQLAFNHSHSQKNYALVSSLKIADLGVDVEDLDRTVRFDALAKHAFHPEEYQMWQDLDCDPTFWFKVWTTKEAILKASGFGIRLSLNQLNTGIHPINDGGVCTHIQLGGFAYQNFNLGHVMLTVAWRLTLSCEGFVFPKIQIIQH